MLAHFILDSGCCAVKFDIEGLNFVNVQVTHNLYINDILNPKQLHVIISL